jgi:superfamily II DNA/RNA helicase
VLLLGSSGSGKTAAYVVPLLQSIDRKLPGGPQAIVLVAFCDALGCCCTLTHSDL